MLHLSGTQRVISIPALLELEGVVDNKVVCVAQLGFLGGHGTLLAGGEERERSPGVQWRIRAVLP